MSLTEEYDAKVEARGEARGEANGEARGEANGELKGILKNQKIVVCNMFKNGMKVQLIANIAQISIKQVIDILKSEGLWVGDSK